MGKLGHRDLSTARETDTGLLLSLSCLENWPKENALISGPQDLEPARSIPGWMGIRLLLPSQGRSQLAFLSLWALRPSSSREHTMGQVGPALVTTPEEARA